MEQQFDFDADIVAPTELNEAIQNASYEARLEIFREARALRQKLFAENDRANLVRLIDIFSALNGAPDDKQHHEGHANLGFIYKDLEKPDWAKALEHINLAIELREPTSRTRFAYYEFNRAICMASIELQNSEGVSDTPTKDKIFADLRAARHYRWFQDRLTNREEDTDLGVKALQEWMLRNDLSIQNIMT